ncbi:MAG: cyclic pyranopterin monophosphate synthase MoaC [Bacteroidales bacterium]|nr:cyclic pyranopterin monophosphate synthase MoaC [Bacteroidales bacterium]
MKQFSHTNDKGKAQIVDVSNKPDIKRTALAEGFIHLSEETVQLIRENNIKKGDVITVARIAGIQAAKRTAEIIPLCHPLPIHNIKISEEIHDNGVLIKAEVTTTGKTGVEMESLVAVCSALLTIYDMCKAVDKNMVIDKIKLTEKRKG